MSPIYLRGGLGPVRFSKRVGRRSRKSQLDAGSVFVGLLILGAAIYFWWLSLPLAVIVTAAVLVAKRRRSR